MRGLVVFVAVVLSTAGCATSPDTSGDARPRRSSTDDGTRVAQSAEPSADSTLGGQGWKPAASAADGDAKPPEPLSGETRAPSTTVAPTAAAAAGTARVLPSEGQYRYRVTGEREWTGALGERRKAAVPPESHENVTANASGGLQIRNMLDAHNWQELTIDVVDGDIRVVRQVVMDDVSGLAVRQEIQPVPFILLGRQPFRPGVSWSINWRDPETGVEARGQGRVLRREWVRTPVTEAEALVIEVEQSFRGTASGSSLLTIWLDPATGLHLRRVDHTDIRTAAGRSVRVIDYTLQDRW